MKSVHRALVGMAVYVAGCAAAPQPDARDVRFEIRGLATKASETAYGTAFTHDATIVVLGDSTAAKLPYLVTVRGRRVSGGDPESPSAASQEIGVLVTGGIGEVSISGGYREKPNDYQTGDTWESEKIELRVTGYMPMIPVDGAPVQN